MFKVVFYFFPHYVSYMYMASSLQYISTGLVVVVDKKRLNDR